MSKRDIVYFMWDCTDAGTIKRARSIAATGYHLLGFSFHRQRYNNDASPEWENVDMGLVADKSYLGRLPNLVMALWLGWRMRRRLGQASLFLARGLDLAVLALAMRMLVGGRMPVVYEVYDVHFTLLEDTLRGKVFRWLERRVLARIDMLAVTSADYVSEYFVKRQGYEGRHWVVENKLPGELLSRPPQGRQATDMWNGERPLVIGWFGALRCNESLDILRRAALALPDRLQVHLRGWPAEMPVDAFETIVASVPNMTYFGPFRSPEDLDDIYGRVDLNWAIDLQFRGGNSDWLLPFRIYEGGFHGVPALGAHGLATGNKVEGEGLGWTLGEPYADALVDFVRMLDPKAYAACRARLERLPASRFAGDHDLAAMFAWLTRETTVAQEAGPAVLQEEKP